MCDRDVLIIGIGYQYGFFNIIIGNQNKYSENDITADNLRDKHEYHFCSNKKSSYLSVTIMKH